MKLPAGRIPKYISASSPKGLPRLMLQKQMSLGYGLNWFDIQKSGKLWFAWFLDNDDITLHNVEEKIGELTNDKDIKG